MTLELDPDRRLALAYVPTRARPAVEALWRLDVSLASVVATGREPLISQIRLAWWRESLEKLDRETAPPEPTLRAVAERVLPLGISGAQLSEMEQGWAALLSPDPLDEGELRSFARARGAALFRMTAHLLGEPLPGEGGGERWALVDLARHSGEPDAGAAMAVGRSLNTPQTWPSRLRPLGMLAALAKRDLERGGGLERQGSPARMVLMLRHRLIGR